MPNALTGSPCLHAKASFSDGGYHFWAFPFLHTLYQDLPPFVAEQLAHLQVLTPHSLCPDCSLLFFHFQHCLSVPPAEGH